MSNSIADYDLKMWKLLRAIQKDHIKRKSDEVVALVHCILIFNYKLNCLGLGEDSTMTHIEESGENLPDGWNDNAYRYNLRYTSSYNNQLYILYGIALNDLLLFNLFNVNTLKVSNVAFPLAEYAQYLQISELADDTTRIKIMANRVKEQLIDPVYEPLPQSPPKVLMTTKYKHAWLRNI